MFVLLEEKMANHPIPDQCNEFIESGMTLITDPRSDKYLNKARQGKSNPPVDRMSKWCGGKNGFDDYVERF
jgi:hypothetical protein